jgi:hypothetical protein
MQTSELAIEVPSDHSKSRKQMNAAERSIVFVTGAVPEQAQNLFGWREVARGQKWGHVPLPWREKYDTRTI